MKKGNFLPALLPLFAVCALTMAGCGAAPDKTYDRNGIAFSYPADWRVTEEEDYGDGGYYLCVEKNGFDSSGLVMITCLDREYSSPEVYTDALLENLREKPQFEDIVVTPAVAGTYGNYPAQVVTYTMSVMGIMPHTGSVWLFETEDVFVAVVEQQADKDNVENAKGFGTIEGTLTIK